MQLILSLAAACLLLANELDVCMQTGASALFFSRLTTTRTHARVFGASVRSLRLDGAAAAATVVVVVDDDDDDHSLRSGTQVRARRRWRRWRLWLVAHHPAAANRAKANRAHLSLRRSRADVCVIEDGERRGILFLARARAMANGGDECERWRVLLDVDDMFFADRRPAPQPRARECAPCQNSVVRSRAF